jgi:predicted dehydrogenase
MFAGVVQGSPGFVVEAIIDPYLRDHDPTLTVRGVEVPVIGSTRELGASTPDAVIVATPDHLHREAVVAAANAGVPVMVEKPLATSREDFEAMSAAVEQSGVYCMVAFENRWNPPFMKMKSMVMDGTLGPILYQNAELSNAFIVAELALTWAAHSSPMWFLMPHTVDLVHWLAASRTKRVSAIGSRGALAKRGVDTWDVVHAQLTLEDGSTASLVSSWVLSNGSPSPVDFTYALVGADAVARTDIGRHGVQLSRDETRVHGILDAAYGPDLSAAPTWMARTFLADVLAGTPASATWDDALAVNNTLFAIERSLLSGQPEEVSAP